MSADSVLRVAGGPARRGGRTVGLEPIGLVFQFESHDAAYHLWQEQKENNRIVVHVDAHHDLWWMPERGKTHIGNYLCPALREGLVREIFWVAPDGAWASGPNRWHLVQSVRAVLDSWGEPKSELLIEPGRIRTKVHGKPFSICRLDQLPPLEESVLLDLDTDFLVLPRVTYRGVDQHVSLPWCWPEELVARLGAQGVRTDLVTIAYSVEGGYTPLEWKYLGDELALELRRNNPAAELAGMAALRQAAEAFARKDLGRAEEKCMEARRLLPERAAPLFRLSLAYSAMGRTAEARQAYEEARAADASYRTAYNSSGFTRLEEKRLKEAEEEFARVLALDGSDAYAHLGIGVVAAGRKDWRRAEAELRQALALESNLVDGWRALGRVLAKQGRLDEAVAAYQTTLKLTLSGVWPMTTRLATEPPRPGVPDPEHGWAQAELGRLYERKGALDQAINAYRMAVALTRGRGGGRAAARLACVYAKAGRWGKAAREAAAALRTLGNSARYVAAQKLIPVRQAVGGALVKIRGAR